MSDRGSSRDAAGRDRALERMSDRYLSLDDEWRIRGFNDGGYEALATASGEGLTGSDLLGRDIRGVVSDTGAGDVYGELTRAVTEEETVRFESNIGELDQWFEFRAHPDEDGLSVYFSSVARESERQRSIEHQTAVINELYDVFSDPSAEYERNVQSLLAVGRRVLGTEYATLSRVDGEDYVFEFVDSEDGSLEAGTTVDLSWTSCEVVVASEERLVLSDMVADAPEIAEKEGNQELGLSCYIGAPVEVDGEVYGTLCFYDREPKSEPFSEWEAGLIDFMGLLVSYELRRRRSERRLRSRNEQLEEFRSVLSHDLRNPVTVAKGYLDLARDTDDPEALDHIDDALDRMDAILNDVSDLAAVDDGSLDPEPLETAVVAREAWKMVPADDVTLEVTAERPIEADESRLQRLLQNLFSNAVTHNEPPLVIEVGDLEDGFYVADTGEGVDEELRERAFESGYTTGGGTGLGLAIVEEIAETHGWSYELTESEAGGARFEFTDVARP